MPMDPAQRHQIEQDAVTAAWEAERLGAWDDAIALLREIANLEIGDDREVILGAIAFGHKDLQSAHRGLPCLRHPRRACQDRGHRT